MTGLLSILDTDKPEILLRAITWLLCMSSAVHALSLTYEVIAPLNQDPFANPNYTIYFSIYAPKVKIFQHQLIFLLATSYYNFRNY